MRRLLSQFPAVGIMGPRQCGKTTLARMIMAEKGESATYIDLERPSDLGKLSDPELYLSSMADRLVVIDEVQRLPELFALLRSLIDIDRRPGRFLLLGSASPYMIRGSSESLAGRISYIEAHPFHLLELPGSPPDMNRHWFRGGFPEAWKAADESQWFDWTDSFTSTFVERDLNTLFGTDLPPQRVQRLWRMVAHMHGQLWNAQTLARSLDLSPTTVNRYVDLLSGAFMLRRLNPFFTNARKRLSKTSKVYVHDSGLLHYLLGVHHADRLLGHPAAGASWEGYVIDQILTLVPRTVQPYFYRTHDGAEMDLVLVKGLDPWICIEIKLSLAPKLTRGMRESINDLKAKHNFIITPQHEPAFLLTADVVAIGLYEFLNHRLPSLLAE